MHYSMQPLILFFLPDNFYKTRTDAYCAELFGADTYSPGVAFRARRPLDATASALPHRLNGNVINLFTLGLLRALSPALLQQQEVTNHDPYQPVSHRDSSQHSGNA
jgi:hypothetical protein